MQKILCKVGSALKKIWREKDALTLFLTFALPLTLVAWLYILICHGAPLDTLLWNGGSTGIFPDLFESIRDGHSGRPYEGTSIYPPFAYLICAFLGVFIQKDPSAWVGDWGSLSVSPGGVLVGCFFFFGTTVALFALAFSFLKGKESSRALKLLALVFLLSPGFLYLLERGNMVILTVLFLGIYLFWYNSESKACREMALIALACATAMKIYPVAFGLLLVHDKRYRDALRCVLYGLIVFFVPFLFMGGFSKIPVMMDNIFAMNAETVADTRGFGYGFKINLTNLLAAFAEALGGALHPVAARIVTGVQILLFALIALFADANWKRIFGLTAFLTLLPEFSWIYNAAYFFLPLVFFFAENKRIEKKRHWLFLVLFLLMFVSLPFGFVLPFVHGINKLSFSTFAVGAASAIMVLALLIETVARLFRKNKTETVVETVSES